MFRTQSLDLPLYFNPSRFAPVHHEERLPMKNDSRRHSRNPCKTHERMDEPAEIVAMRSRRADHRPACTGCRRPHRSGHWGIKHYDGMGEQGIRLRQYLRINVSGQPAWPAHPRMESGFQGTQTAPPDPTMAGIHRSSDDRRSKGRHAMRSSCGRPAAAAP